MPVEPHLSLAFSLESRPGTYALLLGAGISMPAGVLSAWGVLQTLIGDVAEASGHKRPSLEGSAAWWYDCYKEIPTYGGVLAALTQSESERRALLAQFFEPTDNPDERQPTEGHQAVADLVVRGAVRIVLTTNFDLLLERAIRERGVEPVVVSTSEAIKGMEPLHSQTAAIVHLHGDYKTPGTLNTHDELGTYDSDVDRLLDQVFAEYGLVVVGWSAEYDVALRHALERAQARRFPTYWVSPGDLGEQARRLVAARAAVRVPATADDFLRRVADAVAVLEQVARRHPLDVQAAVASVKRDLAVHQAPIRLHDMLRAELDQLATLNAVTTEDFPHDRGVFDVRRGEIEAAAELAVALVAAAVYWGDSSTDEWWFNDLPELGRRRHVGGDTDLIGLTRAPALLVLFAAGVAATARGRYDLVGRLLTGPLVEDTQARRRVPLADVVDEYLLGGDYPARRLHEYLRPLLSDVVALGRRAYVEAWERFEYIYHLRRGHIGPWPYIRVEGAGPAEGRPTPSLALLPELSRLGDTHPLVELFGSTEELATQMAEFDKEFAKWARYRDSALIPGRGGYLPSARHYPGTAGEA